MSPITQLIRWGLLVFGVIVILLAVLLIANESGKVEAWYTAVAMAVLGVLQISASYVVGRLARRATRRGFEVQLRDPE